jgi:hypothetical protein
VVALEFCERTVAKEKPTAFDDLARKLVQVPKRELAAQLKRERKSRAKKKRK